ncbi:MAG: helix-turn-helix transcriptional regulator, partial [Clostridia bacterium]|nr:helix-turn-helix transcriptional regulator [Clostridia bacterium]
MNYNIGKQILKLRKSKGVSQTELALFLGVQSQAVSKWEREICAPDIAKLPQIAAFFEITLDELFGVAKINRTESALSETDELISQKKWGAAAKKAAALAREFPSQKKLVQKMLTALSQALLCKERFSKKFIEEAITLGKIALR